MFENLQAAPPDAILGLNEAFKADPNPQKVNLSVGVYRDSQGVTPILECVKLAERRLLETETSKGYLGIDGSPEYARLVRELLFGSGHEIIDSKRAATVHAPGGTGALRVAGDFVHKVFPESSVWCSQPTWANHPSIFAAAGVNVESYAYYDAATHGLDFGAMLADLQKIPAGDVVCLHACCHNPSGVDPSADQWDQIAGVIYERGLLPLLDFAYQGFAEGLTEDLAGLAAFCRPGKEFLVANSFSKNFGLYCERVGGLTAVAGDAAAAGVVLSQLKSCVRANYSNPPAHGGAIVTTILADAELHDQWEQELAGMRTRINDMRQLFTDTMQAKAPDQDFSFIKDQRGMFSFSGLTPEQVDELRDKHSIYTVRNGRINVGGMTEDNMELLCNAIASVL